MNNTKVILGKIAISTIVLVLLIFQALTTFRVCNFAHLIIPHTPDSYFEPLCPPHTWPILDYPMYHKSVGPNSVVRIKNVHVILSDSTSVQISTDSVSINYWYVMKDLMPAIRKKRHEALHNYASVVEEEYGRRPIGFFIKTTSWVLYKDGAKHEDSKITGKVYITE